MTLQQRLRRLQARRAKRRKNRDKRKRLLKADRRAIKKLNGMIVKVQRRLRRIAWNGHPSLSYGPLLKAARVALSVPGLYVTSTTGGTHSPASYHYKGRAIDCGSNDPGEGPEKRAQQLLLDTFGAAYFAELFGPLPWHVKNGRVYKGTFPGHGDHLHFAAV